MCIRIFRRLIISLIAIVAAGPFESRSHADPMYSVTNLANGGWSLLNNNGQVAGGGYTTPYSSWSYTEIYNPSAGGSVTVVGVTPPSASGPGSYDFPGRPLAMNDSGQLIIQGIANINQWELYNNGMTTALPSFPVAINNSGEITGYDSYSLPGLGSQQAYILSNGVTTQLGVLPGAEQSVPTAINNSGEVVGSSEHLFTPTAAGNGVVEAAASQQWIHAFLYNGSTMVDLGTLGGKESYANAINDNGDVVGKSATLSTLNVGDPNQIFHAFLVPSGGKMIDLGTLAGTNASAALGINDKGEVVGWSGLSSTPVSEQATSPTSHAFLYMNGVMTDLNTVIPPIGVTLTMAIAINNQGQILVDGVDSRGNEEQLLLTPSGQPVPPSPVYPEAPVPEPSTLAIMAFGLLALAAKWAFKRGQSRYNAPLNPRLSQ